MDSQVLVWIRVLHIFTFLTWAGSLVGLSFILKQHGKAAKEAYQDFIELEKCVAIAMDIGATIAMIAGVIMLMEIPGIMKSGGWIHAKLTLVVVLLGLHGFQRMRVGKFKKGKVSGNPAWIIPAVELTIFAIIAMAAAKPF